MSEFKTYPYMGNEDELLKLLGGKTNQYPSTNLLGFVFGNKYYNRHYFQEHDEKNDKALPSITYANYVIQVIYDII